MSVQAERRGQAEYVAQDWQDDAACTSTDPETFYPDRGHGDAAKRVCATCPVVTECLQYALTLETWSTRWGVWGGLSAEERARHARRARRTQ